jgi:DNA polymerase-3 subunit delta
MVTPKNAVYLLVGPEKYLKEKTINDLRSTLLDPSSGELDYKVLHGQDSSAEEIFASLSTIPFFSSKRLVVIKDFDSLSREDSTRLINYIKNPNQYACLVIDTADGSILKDEPSISRYAKVLKFYAPSETEASAWISKLVSSRGKTIDEGAIDILKELQGNDLLNLSQETEKLITYTGTRKKITVEDVEALVGRSAVSSVFDIAHAAAEKDTSKAIAIVHELVSSGKKPYEIIGLLAWHFKTLLKIKALSESGQDEYSITQNLRLRRKDAGRFLAQSAAYPYERIASKLDILLEADLGIKRARFSPSIILEFAVIRLCLGD